VAARTRPRRVLSEPPPEGALPITYQGETAYYSPLELDALRPLVDDPTEENENAVRFIHACKVHLDATYVG
jgi:hypothetical protein